MNKFDLSNETFEKIRIASGIKILTISIVTTCMFAIPSYLVHSLQKTHSIYLVFIFAYLVNSVTYLIYSVVLRKLYFKYARYFYLLIIFGLGVFVWGLLLVFSLTP